MRVLVIVSKLPPSQAPEGNFVLNLCRQLRSRGHDAEVLTGTDQHPPAVATDGLVVHRAVPRWGWGGVPAVLGAVRRARPDVVMICYVAWMYGPHPMVTTLPLLIRALSRRVAVVTQLTNVQPLTGRYPGLIAAAARWMPRRAAPVPEAGWLVSGSDELIVMSERHADAVAAWDPVAGRRATVIPAPPLLTVRPDPTGTVRAAGRRRVGAKGDDVLVTFFGYVYPGKGLETLLTAMAGLGGQGLKWRLAIVGGLSDPPYAERLRRLAASLGVADRVTWAGDLSDADVSAVLRGTDIGALPFDAGVRLNNTTVATLVAHGLPVVSTRGEQLEPPFRHGENIWLCRPSDPAELAGGIFAVAADAELRRTLGAGALRLADDHLSWAKATDATLTVLRRAVAARSAGRPAVGRRAERAPPDRGHPEP